MAQDVLASRDRLLRAPRFQCGLGGLQHIAQFLLLLDFDHESSSG